MKKLLSLTMALIAVSITFSSCDKDEDTEMYYHYSNYLSDPIASTKTASIYTGNTYQTVNYSCKKAIVLYLTNVQAYYYEVHSVDCLSDHLKYEPGLYGTANDWNYFGSSNYWKYNRNNEDVEVLDCTWDFKNKKVTLSNGDVFNLELEDVDGKTIAVRIVNEKNNMVFTCWDNYKY